MPRSRAAVMLCVASLVVACGGTTTTTKTVYVEAGPTQGSYTIAFPSTNAAVATDTVQVFVFDANDDAGSVCFSLILKRKSHQDLPTPLATDQPTTPCDLQKGGAGSVTIPYGNVAVFAVAQRHGADFLLGCATTSVDQGNAAVVVELSPANSSVSVPTSTCSDLSPHCDGKC